MKKSITYKQALEEISSIINEIESGEIDIDQISMKIEKAKELFDFCQKSLKKSKDAVDKILDDKSEL